jgi:hypothetical protein
VPLSFCYNAYKNIYGYPDLDIDDTDLDEDISTPYLLFFYYKYWFLQFFSVLLMSFSPLLLC